MLPEMSESFAKFVVFRLNDTRVFSSNSKLTAEFNTSHGLTYFRQM